MTTDPSGGAGATTAPPAHVAALDAAGLLALFDAIPDGWVAVAPNAPRFTVLAATDAFCRRARCTREELLGRGLFECFPGAAPGDGAAPGRRIEAALRESFATVLRTRAAHRTAVVRHDLPVGDGSVERRDWQALDSPVLGPDGAVWCILHHAEDVTERVRQDEAVREAAVREAAARDAFRVALADALRPLASEAEITAAAARVLGAHLGASRVHYGHVAADDEHLLVAHDWTDGVPSVAGRIALAEFGPEPIDALRAGRTLVVPDVAQGGGLSAAARTACAARSVGALVAVPLVVADRLVAVLAVHQAAPRAWTPAEVALVEEVAERTWYAVERARGEAALRASEARFRSLFDSIDSGFCVVEMIVDEDGRPVDYRFLETNPAFGEQTGLVDAVGRTARELVPGLEARWVEIYGRVALTGEPSRFEMGSDAMGRWFDVYAFRIGQPEGRRVALLFSDVTAARAAVAERERLWDALAAERERLWLLIRGMPAPVALHTGPEHRFEIVSESFRRVSGGRDVTGMSPREAYPELVGQGILERFDQVVATGEGWISPETPVRYDRRGEGLEDTWFDIRYEPVRDAGGCVVGVLNFSFDVTEQVRARHQVERLLAESERARAEAEAARAATERAHDRTARLQALTAALAGARSLDDVATAVVADMVVALGARTGALAVRAPDEAALLLLRTVGFPAPVEAQVHRQPLGLRSPLTECYRTSAPVWIETREGPAGLDARYPVIAPVWDALGVGSAAFVPLVAAGEGVGVISFAFVGPRAFDAAERDFLLALGQQAALAVERARLFEAEHEARQEAEAANRAKAEFLATMSHELRTPLNAIGGYAELIELGIHGPVTEAQRGALERIQRSQRHLLGLIAGVLDYSRLEAGAVNYHLVDVPVAEAVAEAEVLVAPQLRAKGLGYGWSGAAPGLQVRADREKLQQILLNLLSNAVKFTHARDGAPGRIEVACTEDGTGPAGRVRIHVRDTGTGITREKLAHVFEPFVQVDQRLTRPSEGVGLGLAISRDLARGMGGELTVESTPGVGSTFTLELPAA